MPEGRAAVVESVLLLSCWPTLVHPPGSVICVVEAMRLPMQATRRSPAATPAGSVRVWPVARGLDAGAGGDKVPRGAGQDLEIGVVGRARRVG